jgi:hypothetical protein
MFVQTNQHPLLLLVIVLQLISFSSYRVDAAAYRIDATGTIVGKTTAQLGIGFGFANENGNSFTWLRYLGTSLVRVFIQPYPNSHTDPSKNTANWRSFTSNSWSAERLAVYGDQFGRSFDNNEVINEFAWRAAVANVRHSSKDTGKEFFDWLVGHLAMPWPTFLSYLNTTRNNDVNNRQGGNREDMITTLVQQGVTVQALFDFRCKHLEFLSVDPASGDYWKERWEEYRLMYIGARWMAKFNVTITELYNEPDKDIKCMDPTKWPDHMRIRSQAIQDGYADFSESSGNLLKPLILTPVKDSTWEKTYGPVTATAMNMPFPGNDTDSNWTAADGFSYHRYGVFSSDSQCTIFSPKCWPAVGYVMRKNYDLLRTKLAGLGFGSLPVAISEFNCFIAATLDNSSSAYFRGRHVMDFPSTATCLAAQIGGLATSQDPPAFMAVHKFVQSLAATSLNLKSRITKNGKNILEEIIVL